MSKTMDGTRLTESQLGALARMPEIADSQFHPMFETLPASRYTDPDFWDREKLAVFRTVPLVVGASARLPDRRSYFAETLFDVPLLITRDGDGVVHAFANVCRHRGTQLCAGRHTHKGGRISCPYHAWTYALDGELIGVPRQEIFDGLDKKAHSLKPIPCREAGGLIWVGLDPDYDYDFSVVEGPLAADLDSLGLGRMVVFDEHAYSIGANWKLIMDTMLDNYHVTRLHKDTLAPFFVDTENVIDLIGPHIRAASARGNFTRDKLAETFEEVRKVVVFSYVLFPNAIVVVSPWFVSFALLRPTAHDRTEVDYIMLVDEMPEGEEGKQRMRASFELMDAAFGKEDFWVAEMNQNGLNSGMLDHITLGGMEKQMMPLHRAVDDCLAKAGNRS